MTTTAPQPTETETRATGRVVAIAGPVIDVEFPPHSLPEINGAVEVDVILEGETQTITAEVAQQIGDGRVRCICLKATDGLTRGAEVRNLGHGLQVPVGDAVLGHVFPVYAGFKGGKGVGTIAGAGFSLFPLAILLVLVVFIVVLATTHYVSLSSILASLAFPLVVYFILGIRHPGLIGLSMLVAVFIPATHRKNIRRLLNGEERKFDFSRKKSGKIA